MCGGILMHSLHGQLSKVTVHEPVMIIDIGFFNNAYLLFSSDYSVFSLYSQIITHSLADPAKVLPPRVTMNYNGTEYEGELIGYKFRERQLLLVS